MTQTNKPQSHASRPPLAILGLMLVLVYLTGAANAQTANTQSTAQSNAPAMTIQDKANLKIKLGKAEFESTCAVCHGMNAKGNGPFTSFMSKRVPDLTVLANTNGGECPFVRNYEMKNGPGQIPGHDIREMPVWSDYYKEHAAKDLGPFYNYSDVVTYVTNKTISLLAYLATVQEK